MVRASIFLMHNSMDRKGCFVADGVRLGWVGVCVAVAIRVCEAVGERVSVMVCEAVGRSVAVGVSGSVVTVARTDGVAMGGVLEGVAVVTTRGARTYVERMASRKPMIRRMGTAYLRSMSGNAAAVVAGFSPEYPSASSSFWRFAA